MLVPFRKSSCISRRLLSTVVDQGLPSKKETPSSNAPSTKFDAIGMTVDDFEALFNEHKIAPRFQALYAYQFLQIEKGTKWMDARRIPLKVREWLTENCPIDFGQIRHRAQSTDGTRKYLIETSPSRVVECVLIPESERGTLCVSSQMGCALDCSFCHTGTQKFQGNLSAADILKQYLSLPTGIQSMVSNFVFMGQGEPLLNYKNVKKAIEILTDPRGLAFGHGRITVSTSGVVPLIPKVATELKVNLAISLHAPNNELRSQIMNINKTYPLPSLIEACEQFAVAATCATRRISFEYTMLDGINDDLEHANQLISLLRHLPSHVNLIPFNPWPGALYKCTPMSKIERFCRHLESKGLPATIRRTRGSDIGAACGQLKSSLESKVIPSIRKNQSA